LVLVEKNELVDDELLIDDVFVEEEIEQ